MLHIYQASFAEPLYCGAAVIFKRYSCLHFKYPIKMLMKLALCTQIPTLYCLPLLFYPPPSEDITIPGCIFQWQGAQFLMTSIWHHPPMDTDIKNNCYDFSCSPWIVHQIHFHGTVCENHKESWEGRKSRVLVAPNHGTRGIYSPCRVFI